MIDAASEFTLNGLVPRLGRSLLQYVHESNPITTARDANNLPLLARQVQEDQDAAGRIVRFLSQNRRRPPYLGAYPMSFTTINFTNLSHLMPYLIEENTRFVADLEKALQSIPQGDSRQLVQEILELKRRHLHELTTKPTSR